MVKAEAFGPDTYDSCANRVKRMTGVLLVFHPGCGHCVQMRPAWEAMKQRLPQGSRIVEVDGSALSESAKLRELAPFKGLKGFPYIVRVKDGNPIEEFAGPRTPEAMGHFSRPMRLSRPMRSSRPMKSMSRPKKSKRKRKIDTRKKRK